MEINNTLKDKCAIAGIGATEFSSNPKRDRVLLALEAIKKAAADAGIKPQDIDGIVRFTCDGSASDQMIASNLGMKDLAFSAEIPFLGGSACATIGAAAAAVNSGLAKYVVCFRAATPIDLNDFGNHNSAVMWAKYTGAGDFLRPFGWLTMQDTFALLFEAHRAKYGTTVDQLGAIAVAIRKCANRNPRALLYDQPLTIEDYRKSPVVSGHLKIADVANGNCDGACAAIVTTAERARDLKQKPAYIMSAATGLGPEGSLMWEMRLFRSDPTVSPAKFVAPRLFGTAGITPEDIDVAEIYDCSTVNVLYQLEDYGFCKKGEAGLFAESGNIELGGKLPINTSGGMLAEAYVHGFNHIVEGVRQLRGQSSSQVKDAEIVLVTSSTPPPTSAIILRR